MENIWIILYLWIDIMFILEIGCEIITSKVGNFIIIAITSLLSSITMWFLVKNGII